MTAYAIRAGALLAGYAIAAVIVLALGLGACEALAAIGRAQDGPAPILAPAEAPVAPSVAPSAEPSAQRPVVLPSGPLDPADEELDCEEAEEPADIEQCEDEDE